MIKSRIIDYAMFEDSCTGQWWDMSLIFSVITMAWIGRKKDHDRLAHRINSYLDFDLGRCKSRSIILQTFSSTSKRRGGTR